MAKNQNEKYLFGKMMVGILVLGLAGWTVIAITTLLLKKSDDAVPTAVLTSAQKLALLDAASPGAEADRNAVIIQGYLDSLSSYYQEPADSIADWTARVRQLINHEKGFHYSNKAILSDMLFSAAGAGKMGGKYKARVAIYASAITKDEINP
jgi:hypothetical protein